MTDPATTPERAADWWQSAVVYQIYPRSFADSNGDGIGDLPGIIDHLDHLAALGVDVRLAVADLPRPRWTTTATTSATTATSTRCSARWPTWIDLIAGLHERGIKLVMDLVVNHTSDEHPWFVESREPGSTTRDWYVWRPPRPGMRGGEPGAEPNNWASIFSGSAWQYDPASGEYYLHLFSTKQPDLNWENPAVRQAVYDMMRWWVDRGVDGFRMDVINMISKVPGLPDAPDQPGRPYASGAPFYTNGPRLEEFLQEMNAAVGLTDRHLLTVGEMPGSTVEVARRVTDPANRELNMVFTFEHVELDRAPDGSKFDVVPLPLPVLKRNLETWQLGLGEVGWNSLYWNNHDQPRAVSRFGDDSPEHRVNSAKTLGTVLHLHKGTPYVYQGEELGMTNSPFDDIDDFRDIESVNYHAEAVSLGMEAELVLTGLAARSRDNARTPMHWNAGEQAGFTAGRAWLPVNPNHSTINAEAALADPDSVFHHYRRLIELRHDLAVVVHGRFELLLPDHEQLWAFTRRLGDQLLLVVANCSTTPVDVPAGLLADLDDARVLLATHPSTDTAKLQPWESRVYGRL